MPDCHFAPSDSPYKLETNLMILREAERESILSENGIHIPEYND